MIWDKIANRMHYLFILVCLFSGCVSPKAPPQKYGWNITRGIFFSPETDKPVNIDGKLDDSAWATAPVRYLVRNGDLSPLYPGEVRILWDQQNLYIGYSIIDQDIRSEFTKRDSRIWLEGDAFEFFIYIPNNDVKCIELELNPNNAFLDICHREGRSLDDNILWNWPGAKWQVNVSGTLNDSKSDQGWSCELMLPWKGLDVFGVKNLPEICKDIRILAYGVNRIQLDSTRLSRELCFWPNISKEKVTQYDEYGRLFLVENSQSNRPFEGFQRIINGWSRRANILAADYRGLSIPWEYRTADKDAVLKWQSEQVDTKNKTVEFAFVASCKQDGGPGNMNKSRFQLYCNDRPLIEFVPFQTTNKTWVNGDVKLVYYHRAGKWLPSGVYVLTVPSDILENNKPAIFELKATSIKAETEFMIKAYTDSSLFDYYGLKFINESNAVK